MDPREPGKNPSLQTRRHLQGIPKRNKVGRNDLDVSSAHSLPAATLQRRGGGLAAFGEILRSLADPSSPNPPRRPS